MSKYYDIEELIEKYPDKKFYVSFGERSSGKTHSSLVYCLKRYFVSRETFYYLRRYYEDIKASKMKQLFTAINNLGTVRALSGGEWEGVRYFNGCFYLYKIKQNKKGEDVIIRDKNIIGYCGCLSQMEHYKSVSYDGVKNIVFDEIFSRVGYLSDEFGLFLNTLSTIIRRKNDVKILMLANTVSRNNNPYIDGMNLPVREMDVGEIRESGDNIILEYAEYKNKENEEESEYFKFNNNTAKMITRGGWEMLSYNKADFEISEDDVKYSFFIEYDIEKLKLDICKKEDGNYFIMVYRKTTDLKYRKDDLIFSSKNYPNLKNVFKYIDRPESDIHKFIYNIMRSGRVYYGSDEAGEILKNYLNWCLEDRKI